MEDEVILRDGQQFVPALGKNRKLAVELELIGCTNTQSRTHALTHARTHHHHHHNHHQWLQQH